MKLYQGVYIALRLMEMHGVDDWRLVISKVPLRREKGKITLGFARYSDKTITISENLIKYNDIELIYDVMLHEIAHALVPYYVHQHGKRWKKKAIEIGCAPSAVLNVDYTVNFGN